MFDVASWELLIVLLVGLLVIGPKDLPKVIRVIGQWVGKARSVASQFRSGLDDMVRQAELKEMEDKWEAENQRIMREHPAETAPTEEDGMSADNGTSAGGTEENNDDPQLPLDSGEKGGAPS